MPIYGPLREGFKPNIQVITLQSGRRNARETLLMCSARIAELPQMGVLPIEAGEAGTQSGC